MLYFSFLSKEGEKSSRAIESKSHGFLVSCWWEYLQQTHNCCIINGLTLTLTLTLTQRLGGVSALVLSRR